jgi:hypothetical protein
MADQEAAAADAGGEHIPFMQQLMDNPFVLLFIGITVPAVFYIIWGVMEVVSIPVGQ